MLKPLLHYGLHFGAPFLLAMFFKREHRLKALCIMLCTMLVDADHLLATPVFSPDRMSVGFHPLHSYPAIAIYATVFALTFILPRLHKHLPIHQAPQQRAALSIRQAPQQRAALSIRQAPQQRAALSIRQAPQQRAHLPWWLRPLCLGLLCHMLIDYLDFTLWH